MECKKCKSKGWEESELCNNGECPHCCESPLGQYVHTPSE